MDPTVYRPSRRTRRLTKYTLPKSVGPTKALSPAHSPSAVAD